MSNETKKPKKLSIEDERPIYVSNETKQVINLLLATNELYKSVYEVLGRYYHLDGSSSDDYFSKEFEGTFKKLNDSLYELLGESVFDTLGIAENITDDFVRI